ncbi:hypothetical protein SB861_03465 [Paraburkholderia sp. SIMBA_049]
MRTLVLLCALLSSCTVIYQTGSNNTISDANNHGDFGLTREGSAPQPTLLDRLRGHEAH